MSVWSEQYLLSALHILKSPLWSRTSKNSSEECLVSCGPVFGRRPITLQHQFGVVDAWITLANIFPISPRMRFAQRSSSHPHPVAGSKRSQVPNGPRFRNGPRYRPPPLLSMASLMLLTGSLSSCQNIFWCHGFILAGRTMFLFCQPKCE